MSFTVTTILKVNQSYPEILLEVASGERSVDITYEVIAIERVTDGVATVWYTRTVDGVTSPWNQIFEFKYSGTTISLDEAESALKQSLG